MADSKCEPSFDGMVCTEDKTPSSGIEKLLADAELHGEKAGFLGTEGTIPYEEVEIKGESLPRAKTPPNSNAKTQTVGNKR